MPQSVRRVATDVGGTFTDLVAFETTEAGMRIVTAKSDTTPPNFEQGVLNVMTSLEEGGIAAADVDFIAHGTTVVINALTERKGVTVGLITTQGFRDTLEIARKKFPGSPASLDALCRRFNIDNSSRTLHGALLDSEILADVYLELIGGRQPDFALSAQPSNSSGATVTGWTPKARPSPLPSRLSQKEAAAHEAFVAGLGDSALWLKD